MRLHGDRLPAERVTGKDGRQHQHTGGPNEVWSFGRKMKRYWQPISRLRDAMRPYTRRLMEEAHSTAGR